jgi:uncharacterized protein (TIGR02266 family)
MPTPKVLLVDDVNMFLELEKSFLKLSPVRILTARDGVEALEVIKSERPDMVFMDLNMPRMTGAECCAAVKADPEISSIPIVIITTAGKQEDREHCQKAGCDDFITKPVERKSFLEMARKYLHTIERREMRVPCKLAVTVTVHSGTFTAESCDISEKGIYLATDTELAHGAAVSLRFSLPDEAKTPVETRGRVVWINGRNNRKKVSLPDGFGIEFVSLPENAVEVIRGIVMRRGAPL